MIHDGLEFHNIAELARVENKDGLRLQRVPERVRSQLDEGTAGVMLSASGGEIRFRIKDGAESVSIRLSAELPTIAYVYYGPFQARPLSLNAEPKDFVIKPHKRQALLTEDECAAFTYNPRLVRICFGGAYPEPVLYHGHTGEVCLPRDGDAPSRVYLAYGTSITHGTDDAGAAISYPAHVAWKLGFDLRNLGASGCCLCEPALADFLAEQRCDLVTLELSVNMLGRGFTAAQFRERAAYLVQRVADADPARPVACITLFPHYNDKGDRFRGGEKATSAEYRQVLRDIVKDLKRPNLSIIEGPDLLKGYDALCMDLIHPGARGMIQIGEELARRIKPIVKVS